MRWACYGWVAEHAGSVASADYVVLRELLDRGHEVDLYANEDHVPMPAGLRDGAFRYFGLRPWAGYRSMSAEFQRLINWSVAPLVRGMWRRTFRDVVHAEHARRSYDAVLSLGTCPAFCLPGVPTIAWMQSPLHTELDAIRRLRAEIVAVSGRAFWLALVAYYWWSQFGERGALDCADHVIVGSDWSRTEMIGRGADPRRVHVLPYPIDLVRFHPPVSGSCAPTSSPVVVSLGRLDPRKRLDLLLDAFELVADDDPTVRLIIVGRQGYAPRQLTLLGRCKHRDRVEYVTHIARQEVPKLLCGATVLAQVSENENFGSSVAEALACGVPVVVGPTNGTADYVDDYSECFERYEAQSVAAAIRSVIERMRTTDPAVVRESTRSAAEHAFSVTAVADGLCAIASKQVE